VEAQRTPVWRGAIFSLLVAWAMAVSPASAYAERTLALSAGSFAFEVDPGQEKSGEVIVINESDEPIKVLVYTSDQIIDEEGEITYKTPDRDDPDFARRPTSWVRLRMPAEARAIGNTPYLDMAPGQRIPVEFVFQPPLNAAPGDQNVVLFFEMFDMPEGEAGAVTQVRGRIGSRLQMRVTGEHIERMSIRPFVVPGFVIGNQIPFDLTLRNEGNLDQRLSVAVVLFDRNDLEIARSEPHLASVVFAGNNRRLQDEIAPDRQLFGFYNLQAEVYRVDEAGNIIEQPEQLLESRSVWVIPLWVIVAFASAVLILLARVAWHVLRVRPKKSQRLDSRAEARRLRQEERERGGTREEG